MTSVTSEEKDHWIKGSSTEAPKQTAQNPKRKVPYDFQQKAIDNVIEGFKHEARGQLIMPCGTGKTLISLWIYERLNSQLTLVLFPSLALLRQTKNEWLAHAQKSFSYMCVCSEKDIDSNRDAIHISLKDLGGIVSTEPSVIQNFLKKHDQSVIFSTYQSLESIAIALQGTRLCFDLALCDEAHKTAGIQRGIYSLIHDQSRIPVHKRLYMTATPRVLTDSVKSRLRAREEVAYIADMSDPTTFGNEFYRMSFKEAIDLGVLVDYKIVAIGITDRELQGAIREEAYIDKEVKVEEIANNYALGRFMTQYQANSVITFHASVKSAADFKKRHQKLFNGVKCFHVNGTQSTQERHKILDEFVRAPQSIVTNARCLTEGVNIPAVDGVFFCDPKNSKVDIVQAAGRALRRSNDHHKTIGYIVVPIYHRHEDNLENVIENGVFVNLINVIRALSNQDERIIDTIRQYTHNQSWFNNSYAPIKKHPIEFLELGSIMQSLKEGLFAEVIDKIRLPYQKFNDARFFARSLSLQSVTEWRIYTKSNLKPSDIPADPYRTYQGKGWSSWGDWLGLGITGTRNRLFRPFKEARAFIHELGLKSHAEWLHYRKTKSIPADIPSEPHMTYKGRGWVSWGDWLGTGSLSVRNRKYRSYEEAKLFVSKLGLKSQNDWKAYIKSRQKPIDIPATPYTIYKDKGWISWGDWLGTGNVSVHNKQFRSFETAKDYVHNLGLKSKADWSAYAKSGKKPGDIPVDPYRTYKEKGWVSWGDWLGTGTIAPQNKKYRSFEAAKRFVHQLHLKSKTEWSEYQKSMKKPNDIPADPYGVYKDKGWVSWGDWLGTRTDTAAKKRYKSYEEAKAYVRTLGIQSPIRWQVYVNSGTKPDDIPARPNEVYKGKGWVSWEDWLGI